MIKTLLQKIAKDTDGKVELKLILLFIPVAYFSYMFHEFGHWTIGEILGNSMTFSLNNVSPQSGQYIDSNHSIWADDILVNSRLLSNFITKGKKTVFNTQTQPTCVKIVP
jgi:hypothetical protein